MCGLAGIRLLGRGSFDEKILRRMVEVQRHRGPDDTGFFIDQKAGIALGHCRLSIIDLATGHQPLSNEDGTIWVVFNGEIYNFGELRQRLEGLHHRFGTQSDTEVIVHAYEEYGERCVDHLRGMFAFAIWDGRDRSLFLARDRMGKKPLYYYQDTKKFLFASEPKGILQGLEVPAGPDFTAIHHYLTYGYVPSPLSAFRGIRKLPPAHFLLLRAGTVRVERYWRLQYRPRLTVTEQEVCEELLSHLRKAVRLRLISDVPLGAFLSGGIDSSTVVALMSEYSSGPVKTFSIGFEEEAYNELPYARLVAQRYGTDHHEFIVKPDALAILPELVWHYNEPYADSSAIPTYYLSKMTREHVKVTLSGDAGDENFAGYERYLASRIAGRYDKLPRLLRRSLEWGIGALPEVGPFQGLYRRGKRFFAVASEEPRQRYARWVGFFTNAGKEELYTRAFREATARSDSIELLLQAYDAVDAFDFVNATLGVDVAMYLPEDLLVKMDIASMAHSLEVRSPMVDHVFMEFAASIPSGLKLKGLTKKYIFKQAVRGLLPKSIIDRPKMGFGVPIDRWFRRELREMAYDTLLDRRCLDRGLFRQAVVQRLLDEHVSGRAEWHFHLWSLLFLELWFQRFIDQGGRSGT